jgi:hypothetical protein
MLIPEDDVKKIYVTINEYGVLYGPRIPAAVEEREREFRREYK